MAKNEGGGRENIEKIPPLAFQQANQPFTNEIRRPYIQHSQLHSHGHTQHLYFPQAQQAFPYTHSHNTLPKTHSHTHTSVRHTYKHTPKAHSQSHSHGHTQHLHIHRKQSYLHYINIIYKGFTVQKSSR